MYQVKFTHYSTGETVYGIYHDTVDNRKHGLAMIELLDGDLLPVHRKDLVEIPMKLGRHNPATGEEESTDEFQRYVQGEFRKAQELSEKLPDGVHVGKLFRIGVADGFAYYVVIEVNPKTVDIAWRGFYPDRYVDRLFGYGGRFSKEEIAPLIRDSMRWLAWKKR